VPERIGRPEGLRRARKRIAVKVSGEVTLSSGPDGDGLDPTDWPSFRALCHDALDEALDYLEGARDRPVWTPVPEETRTALNKPLPLEGEGPAAVRAAIVRHILPFATGNTHPRFFGWVHGTGTPGNLLADLYGSAMNANLGGRDHAPMYVERQVMAWCREIFSFPETSGGLLVVGTSAATLLAMAAARDAALGDRARKAGLQDRLHSLVGYASAEAHECVAKAFQVLGLGRSALRLVPVDERFRIDVAALRSMIAEDRRSGFEPFCVIGSAGTVNSAAVDPLAELATVCESEELWFHVDGAFGALAILSSAHESLLAGIERADSLAFDFHKWMHVQYDAGCVLVRDESTLRRAFGARPDYLMHAARGLAGGDLWPAEIGLDLSRGFRALRVWATLKEHGTRAIGAAIARNCDQATLLGRLVEQTADLELLAPVSLNIVCFRFRPSETEPVDLDQLNLDIVADVQESGIAAPSTTRIDGVIAIRVNLTNHRTRDEDLEILLDSVLEFGRRRIAPSSVPEGA
jgi:aromatic-L-amino-acid decarboxylase